MNKKDKKSKNLIKKFLVASAAVSGLVGVSGSAFGVAVTRTTNNTPATTHDGNNFDNAATVTIEDTLVFGGVTHVIQITNDLSAGGLKLNLNNLDLVGNAGKITIGAGGNNGKLRLNAADILNHKVTVGARLKIDFAKASTNALENQLILFGDFSAGQIHSIDLSDKANASAVLLDGVNLNVEDILSNGNTNNSSFVDAKANFEITTKNFGGVVINQNVDEFKLFTVTANSTGKITFDTKAAGVAMNAANKIKFYNNGKLELSSTAPNNSVTFTADLDIDDKTATITFSGGGDGNGFNIYGGGAAADRIKGAKNTSFVIDMADPNALVDLSKVTNASFLKGVAADTAQKLTIKKGRTLVSKDAKFATITFEGSEKGNGTLALAGAADEIHTIKLAEASPENTGVLEITAQNQSLDANSTIFTENSPGVRELYFSDDKTLTLTKESNNIDALYITSKVGQDNTGTLALVGSATLGSTTTDSYIGWYPSAVQVDNGAIKADEERVKAITLTTTEDNQEMVFNQKKIRLGKFNDDVIAGGANSGIIANHTTKSSNWTFSGNDIRSHFTVADANTKAKVIFNNQDDAGITLAGTWGATNKLNELVIATKGHVKLDNSKEQTAGYNAHDVALGGSGNTAINTKLLKFETDVNIIASDTVLSLANVDAISAEGKGGIIIASSSAVYDPTNTIGAGFSYGTGVSKDHVKKLVDGKVARFGITGEADVTIATDADKTKVMGIKIADLVDLDASNLKIVTLKHNKGAVVIEGKAKLGDIGSTEFNFAEARFLGTKEATYTNNVFAKNVAIKAASDLVFNGNIYNQDAIEITGDKTVAFGGNVGNIKSSAAELTFNGKDKTIGNLGAASTAAAPTNYIQQKANFINGSASVGSVYAKDLNVKDYEFKISEAKVMHANNSSTQENATYTFNDATSSLELTTPTEKHVYSKTLTLNLKRSNDTSQSKIIFNDLSKIDLDNVSAIAINLEASYDSDVTPDVATSKALVFIGTPDNADTSKLKTKLDQVSKLYPKNPNRFQSYSRNGLFIVSKVVSIKDAADNIYNDLIADTKVSNEDAKMVRAYIESFSDASPNSAFSRFLQKIETNQDKAKANQNIVTFVKNTQEAVKNTYNVISSTAASVASGIADGLGNRMAAVAVSSSGDENPVSSVGAYLQPFMSFADNSEEGNKYSLSGGGFTIGGDVGLNDNNTILGLAYTFASNKLKFKNSTSDTTNASTNAFSVYATQKIASGAFVEGLFTYASTDARANLNRVSGIDAKGELTYKTIKNDYNVKTMIGRALLGYSYQMDSFVISPLVGAEFVSTNTKDGVLFKEKDIPAGTSIKAKNTVNPAVLLGARFATEIDYDDMKIIPTAGLLMKFKLSDKDMEVSQALDGFKGAYVYKKNKLSKFSVVPSVGVTVKQNQMEYSATYAADISSKYLGHNAGLKVKINF